MAAIRTPSYEADEAKLAPTGSPAVNEVLETKEALDATPDLVKDTVEATHQYTNADYKRVLRKTDMIMMPLMWIAFGIQQADKTGIATMATFGLRTDTHLVGQQYAWLTTIFFLGYLAAELPGNVIMQKTGMRLSISVAMLFWGGIVMSTAGAKNWTGLMIIRFLQGTFESIIAPAFMIVSGMWYKTDEVANRIVLWGTGNSGFTIITSLVMYAIGTGIKGDKKGDPNAWKACSYFLGGITFVTAVFMYFFFGSPREVRWLSEEDKRIQAARVVGNNTGTDREKRSEFKWEHVRAFFRDPQTYLIFFIYIVNTIPTGGIGGFANIIYTGFGFTALEALSKGTIPYSAFIVVWFIVIAIMLRKFKNLRFVLMMLSTLIAFCGAIACGMLNKKYGAHEMLWPKWGTYLLTGTGSVVGCIINTLLPTNIAGRTKKSLTGAVMFSAYCAGNSIGAQVFQARWAPKYSPSLIILGCMYGLQFVLFTLWASYYIVTNRRRRAALEARGISEAERIELAAVEAEKDVTDYDNPYFIYSY